MSEKRSVLIKRGIKVFVLQPSCIRDRYNPDGLIIRHLLEQISARNMDTFTEIPDLSMPHPQLLDAERKGKRIIPIGTLEYVSERIRQDTDNPLFEMQPIEIPEKLRHLANRRYSIMSGKDIPQEIIKDGKRWFLKDASVLKGWNNLLNETDTEGNIIPLHRYVVSERVLFESEYRVFVLEDEVRGIQLYQGDPLCFPDGGFIKQACMQYTALCEERPHAYTMDIGISSGRTMLIEIHPFVSCGLYGFCDTCLPDMFDKGYSWYLR